MLTKYGMRNAPLLFQRKIVYWLIHGHEWPIINTKLKVYKQFFPPDLGRHLVSPFLLSDSPVAEVHATQIPISTHRWQLPVCPSHRLSIPPLPLNKPVMGGFPIQNG
jgi:hypothetical protein